MSNRNHSVQDNNYRYFTFGKGRPRRSSFDQFDRLEQELLAVERADDADLRGGDLVDLTERVARGEIV